MLGAAPRAPGAPRTPAAPPPRLERRRAALPLLLLASSMLLGGCGSLGLGEAFGPTFPDNQRGDLASVLRRLEAAPPAARASMVVGLSGDELFAFDLEAGELRWRVAVTEAQTAPHLAGPYVLLQEAGGVSIRSLREGSLLLSIADEGLHLVGGDGEGSAAVFALSAGSGMGGRSRLIVIRDGRIHIDAPIAQTLGAPALSRGMLFVPWATQNVSVIDVETRDELARVRITDTMVGRAFVLGGSVYVGQRGLFRFDEAIASGNREGASYFEHDRAGGELPGDPPLFIDPYSAPPPAAGGSHRVRLHWHPATGSGDVHPAGGLVYHVFYRIVFALDAADGRVRWAYSHPATIVGSAASGEGLLLVDQEGGVFRLGEDGAEPEPLGLMDLQPTVAVIREGLDSRSSAAGPVDPVDPAQSLLAAIRLSDARLAPARAFAARRLAAMPDEAITPLLIELCADPRLTQTVRDGACEGLGRRSSGASSVLSALSQHASFMEARPAPPAGPLAQAAARMGADAAIPAILAHLRDPATPERDLPALVRALGSLAAEDANEPLLAFLRLYHADAQSDAMVATLTAIAETVLESGDANARDALREIAAAPLGVAVVGERINQAIAAQEQAEARAADAGRPPAPEEESSEGGDATPRRR